MFWWLWLGLLLFLCGTWLGAYAWNGAVVGGVTGEKGRKLWTASVALNTAGLFTLLASVIALGNFQGRSTHPLSFTEFWVACSLLGLGAVLCILVQTRNNIVRERAAISYGGLLLLAAGAAGILWLMFPDNFLYGVITR